MQRAKSKSSPERDNQSKKSTKPAEKNMHYASASRARERDRKSRSFGRGNGVFRCLSGKTAKLLILIAVGFAIYSFASSHWYFDKNNGEKVHNDQNVQKTVEERENVLAHGHDRDQNQLDLVDDDEDDDDDDTDSFSEEDDDGESEVIADVEYKEQDIAREEDNVQPEKNYDHVFKYHVLQTLTNTDRLPHLKKRFEVCLKSILDKSSVDLLFFFVVDGPSKIYLETALQDITNQHISKAKFQFIFLDIDALAKELAPLVEMMQEQIQGNHPYYKDAIFFLSTMLHKELLPEYVHRVIMLDTDLVFMSDIKELFEHFDHFQGDNIMGVVHEQQPVYRHIFSLYRSQNPGTRVGNPPPDGLTGFNSGVLLLDLDRMLQSVHFEDYMRPEKVVELRDKFHFKGHLGDQDFYTLVSMEMEDLFYNLPCSWNKQLCSWWKDKGYADVWDQYYVCKEKINIYHGNCNTPIPF
ncbi:xyloside xylosyltransferase 1-like [Strongylocentrotus purpuratus]|uniref:Xyloside xylosyltransferase 1 n=1 Tax=Strongylocentrotus purpuratus TaxID=7668 RepID=A0A7M7NYV2_STRPU|nr:xyloside xylosyltransferase 1-like [Strongylocentrotus purpuratus]